MDIQIFGTKKCKNTGKALRFFKERGIKIHFVDLKEKKISKGELSSIVRSVALDDLIDKNGREYKDKNFQYIEHDVEEVLLENPLLFITPIVRSGSKAVVGYQIEKWKELIQN